MKFWKFEAALTESAWIAPAYVQTDAHGNLLALSCEIPNQPIDEEVKGFLLPGFYNAHSHAFQYAFAGLTEYLPAGKTNDDFWSWREAMYKLAAKVNPDQMQALASMLYAEMVRWGYTHVAEFHYLHHNADGSAYAQLSEMSERLILAAQTAGINITLLPMFYQQGGFNTPASQQQQRFVSYDLDAYLKLHEAVHTLTLKYPNARSGIGIHSLRAVSGENVLQLFKQTDPSTLKHLHIAEQIAEVKECLAATKLRPVEWLAENVSLDQSFHLVHATHINEKERQQIIGSKANVVLCPSTEANLGDGLFPLVEYMQAGGRWSIGTDSHISLSPLEELKFVDGTQRLLKQKRNALCFKAGEDSGQKLYHQTLSTGKMAVGDHPEYFKIDSPFNGLVIDSTAPVMTGKRLEKVLSSLIFSSDNSCFLGTLLAGKWKVKEGQHVDYKAIYKQYQKTIRELI